MLTKEEAHDLLKFKFEGSKVEVGIDWRDGWLFRIFLPIGGGEENMNPFFSVHKETGEVTDFSPSGEVDKMGLMQAFAIEDAKTQVRGGD